MFHGKILQEIGKKPLRDNMFHACRTCGEKAVKHLLTR
jgi:hypothetical protein